MKIPLNRFIAFVKPWLNVIAGAAAAWLVAKANVLGIPGLDEANTATWIAGALTAVLTAAGAQLGDLKWLKGHHIAIEADSRVQAAAIASAPPVTLTVPDTEPVEDPEADAVADDELPTDEEELAAPPPELPAAGAEGA